MLPSLPSAWAEGLSSMCPDFLKFKKPLGTTSKAEEILQKRKTRPANPTARGSLQRMPCPLPHPAPGTRPSRFPYATTEPGHQDPLCLLLPSSQARDPAEDSADSCPPNCPVVGMARDMPLFSWKYNLEGETDNSDMTQTAIQEQL